MFEAKEIIYHNNDWITLVFLSTLIVLAIVKVVFNDRLFHANTLFLSKKYHVVYFNKEKGGGVKIFHFLLFIIRLLVLSLLFYYADYYYQFFTGSSNFYKFISIFLGFTIYFSLQYFMRFILAYLFNSKIEFAKISYDKMSYFNNVTLWLLPFLFFMVYVKNFNKLFFDITFLLFVFLFILRYTLVLINNKKLIFNNLFYFILYLCSLEIAPLIIVLKLTIKR